MKEKYQYDPNVKAKDFEKNNRELQEIYKELKENPDLDSNIDDLKKNNKAINKTRQKCIESL